MRLSGAVKPRRGDTLIEVVFALAILASILVAITSGAITAWRTSRLAGERSQAAGLVTAQAEALKAYSFAEKFDATFESKIDTAVSGGGCMTATTSSPSAWELQISQASCGNIGPDMGTNKYSAEFSRASAATAPNCKISETPSVKLCSIKIAVRWTPLGSVTPATSSQIVTITEQ